MNTTQQAHPDREKLSAFISGRLGSIDSAAVEQHLAECSDCCAAIESLPGDTLVSLLSPETDTQAASTPDSSNEPLANSPSGYDLTIAPVANQTLAAAKSPLTADLETPSQFTADVPPELRDHPRYRLIALLGRGGMGAVYEAEHRVMNRPVAIKVIDRRLVQTPGLVDRFHREVQTAAKLSHPNIVTAYDAEQAGELHFLVMELVRGKDLAEIVQQRGPLPVPEACDYIRQAAQGLQHAHERGMVHRDIKPQNLMLQASPDAWAPGVNKASPDASAPGVIKILDFGLAHFVAEISEESGLTQVGSMMGTPDYMSPEQARDAHSADIRSDIYSLGCTLYCLLSGRAPFPQGTMVEKILNHVQNELPPLSDLRSDVPPELAAALIKMTAKSPADRYQTPAEVVEALQLFTDPRRIGFQPVPQKSVPQQKPSGTGWKSILLIVAAAFAFFAILAGVIVVVTDRGRIEIQSEVDDVDIVIKQGGKEIAIIDAQTGSQVKWLPSGKYDVELKGDRNDLVLNKDGFKLTRFGHDIVTLSIKGSNADLAAAWMAGKLKSRSLKKFESTEPTITQDGVTAADGGWKIEAAEPRTARLFEVPMPGLEECVVLYRAKLKSENVTGRAYLEMFVRLPGGEFFSKGLQNPVTGTTGWSEYEIPFILQKGQRADLVKLNVNIEGTGTVWIKDVELAKAAGESSSANRSAPISAVDLDTEMLRFDGHQGPIRAIAWTPDGKTLLSGSGFPDGDKTIRLWNCSTGREIRQLTGHRGQVFALDINSSGDRALAACDDKSIHLWNLTTGEHLQELRGHTEDPTSAVFTLDGRQALSASHDKTIKLWDLEEGTVKREFKGHSKATMGLAVLPGNRQFLSGSWDGSIRLWDLETGDSLRTFSGHSTWDLKILPDGLRFLSAGDDGTLRLWEIASGKQLRTIHAHDHQIFSLDISPDGQHVASAGSDGFARVFQVETGHQLARIRHKEFVYAIAFGSDGESLVSAGGGGWKSEDWDKGSDWAIRLWKVPTRFGKFEIKELPRRPEQTPPEREAWKGPSKETPSPAVAPFIILAANAQSERKFPTLSEAVVAAKDRDTIEIRGNGPFVTDSVSTDNKALTIRAGKGFQPVIRLSPQDIEADQPLLQATASLVLEGLDLQMMGLPAWDAKNATQLRMISVENAPLHIANCRLAMLRRDETAFGVNCIVTTNSPNFEMRNCFFAEGGPMYCPHIPPPNASCLIENCLLRGGIIYFARAYQWEDVRAILRQNTFAGWTPCHLHFLNNHQQEAGTCQMEWTSNIMAPRYHLGITQIIEQDAQQVSPIEIEKLLRSTVSWKERGNLFSLPPGAEFIFWTANNDPLAGTKTRNTLAAYEQFWNLKDTGSMQAKVRFKNSQALEQKDGLTPDDFRLAKGSPGQGVLPEGKDLGADMDLVGPGMAYEKWQSSPEYQHWFKRTEQIHLTSPDQDLKLESEGPDVVPMAETTSPKP